MKILIVYGTTEGQTRKISTFLKDEAEKLGHQVTLADSTGTPPLPSGYDVVLIGASLHVHKYQTSVFHYIKNNAETLNKTKSGFFSVSLTAAGNEPESWKELEEITAKLLQDTDWNPKLVEQVAGALLYTKYDFFKKLIMRILSKRSGGQTDTAGDYEYTNWDKVKIFLEKILKA